MVEFYKKKVKHLLFVYICVFRQFVSYLNSSPNIECFRKTISTNSFNDISSMLISVVKDRYNKKCLNSKHWSNLDFNEPYMFVIMIN